MKFLPPEPVDYARYTGLKLSLDDRGVMTVMLSNPGKKNAVTLRQQDELTTIWDDMWLDPQVRAVVLTGEGTDFCSGADVSELSRVADQPKTMQAVNRNTRYARKHVLGPIEFEKPVIAKVRGVAYGMGVNLALACDMVFAAQGARFCDSHVKIGLVAGDGGALLWPMAVGIHRAKEYLMTGEPVPANVAAEIGLINRCLPDDELDAHVDAMMDKLLALPPHAVNYTKMSLNQVLKQVAMPAFETSLAYEVYSMGMEDVSEATSAFVEKRKGNYTGN